MFHCVTLLPIQRSSVTLLLFFENVPTVDVFLFERYHLVIARQAKLVICIVRLISLKSSFTN